MTIVPISVDIETSGSIPGMHNLLQIGACLAERPDEGFFVDVKPINDGFEQQALDVTDLSMETQRRIGLHAEIAMLRFTRWVENVSAGGRPLFVGLGAAFDWSFSHYYMVRFMGHDVFGYAPLDLKSLYMGRTGLPWSECTSSRMDKVLGTSLQGNHTPLDDARYQAELYRRIMAMDVAFAPAVPSVTGLSSTSAADAAAGYP